MPRKPRKPKVWHFLPEITRLLKAQLQEDDQHRWGDTWLTRPRVGQATRIKSRIRSYFDQLEHGHISSDEEIGILLKIIGNAAIALIRILHPDLFPPKSTDEMAPPAEK